MTYWVWLAGISLAVAVAERLWPWRPDQTVLRRTLPADVLHLVVNGHFLGVALYVLGVRYVMPGVDAALAAVGVRDALYRGVAADWPLAVQIVVALVVIDLVQWVVHNLLHRVPFLWPLHEVHHSVKDGEMDWIVAFRFSWTEVVVYKAVQFAPLAWLGFAGEAVFVHAVFGTLIGHLNHANVRWDYGPLKYVLNSPRMHLWHHDFDGPRTGRNFGIVFSVWDWLFGTAYLPDHPPRKLGYPGVEAVPTEFFAQEVWPLQRLVPAVGRVPWLGTALGALLLGAGWWVTR